jgi:hypothetical protein
MTSGLNENKPEENGVKIGSLTFTEKCFYHLSGHHGEIDDCAAF